MTKRGKIYIDGVLYGDTTVNDRVTNMQEYIAWIDNFEWSGKCVWHKKSSGGGPVDAKVLKTMPTFMSRGRIKEGQTFYIFHPMMNDEGAEIILMRYSKRNGKKGGHGRDPDEGRGLPKKGYGVAAGSGENNRDGVYFAFWNGAHAYDIYNFMEEYGLQANRHYGIALRIPNPDYTGPATPLKNATYKGVPESLYSDVLPIRISYSDEDDNYGIGLI